MTSYSRQKHKIRTKDETRYFEKTNKQTNTTYTLTLGQEFQNDDEIFLCAFPTHRTGCNAYKFS